MLLLCARAVTENDEETRAQTVETAADDDESTDGIEMGSVASAGRARYEADSTPLPPRYTTLKEGKQLSDSDEIEEHHEQCISGAQDAATAGARARDAHTATSSTTRRRTCHHCTTITAAFSPFFSLSRAQAS